MDQCTRSDDANGPRMSRRHGRDSPGQDVAGRPRAAADGGRRPFAWGIPGRHVRQPSGAGGADLSSTARCRPAGAPRSCRTRCAARRLNPWTTCRLATMRRTFFMPVVTSRTVLTLDVPNWVAMPVRSTESPALRDRRLVMTAMRVLRSCCLIGAEPEVSSLIRRRLAD
jgi:hypothetical protein